MEKLAPKPDEPDPKDLKKKKNKKKSKKKKANEAEQVSYHTKTESAALILSDSEEEDYDEAEERLIAAFQTKLQRSESSQK